MDKEKLIEWLNLQADLCKKMDENKYFDECDIFNLSVREKSIHISGARIICNLIGIEKKEESWECGRDTAIRTSFRWNGVEFFTLEDFKEGRN